MNRPLRSSMICLATLSACPTIAWAGVRHSRGLGGTGQPIPKAEQRPAPAADQSIQYNSAPPVQIPGQYPQQMPANMQQPAPGMQQPMPANMQQPAPGMQQPMPANVQQPTPGVQQPAPLNSQQPNPQGQIPAYQPVVVPPPVPVQVPTQMSFEPPIQVPQQQPVGTQAPAMNGAPAANQLPAQNRSPAAPAAPQMPLTPPAGASQFAVPQPQQPAQPLQPLPAQGLPTQPPMSAGQMMADRYVQPSYGMAGCGLGSMIFKNNTRSEQWLASILNDAIIPQSIVITTGTSNCVDVDQEQLQAEQEIFIDTNLHALRLESARGDGENLRAFADLLGCQKDGLFDAFASSSQGQHSFIFSDSQPSAIAERYREVLKRSRALKARCERLF